MTTYFDQKHEELRIIEELGQEKGSRQLADFDAAIVWDLTLAAEFPGFPVDLRFRVHKLILQYSTECQPVNAKEHPDYDGWDEHCRALNKFVWDAHSIFHDVVQRNIPGFTDDPRAPLRAVFTRGEEYREQLVESTAAPTEPPG